MQALRAVCDTRALKNSKHLQAAAPHVVPKEEPSEGFRSVVSIELLNRLDRITDLREVEPYENLYEFLKTTKLPTAGNKAVSPLFSGTLVFVKFTFNTPDGAIAVSDADIRTAMEYANLAVVPISRYASQYGPNSLSVSRNVVRFTVSLNGDSYNNQTLESWVNGVVAQNQLGANSCVVVLNPRSVTNTDAPANFVNRTGVFGYHEKANVPFAFVNLFGPNITVQDPQDNYATALSHEIAEMTVDPEANLSNPEVCDACGPNCQTAFRDFFDGTGNYIETTQAFPPVFAWSFFLNAIVKPNFATQCPPRPPACVYAPPSKQAVPQEIKTKGIKTLKRGKVRTSRRSSKKERRARSGPEGARRSKRSKSSRR